MQPVINGYNIIKEIKPSGAWSNVYLAEFQNKKVALKVLKQRYILNFSNIKTFITEAETIKRFKHPNLPRIHHICNPSSPPYYYSMDYYSRGNLDTFIKKRKILTTNEIVEISVQICRALNAINDEGYLHLDLKPSNVLFGNNNQVIITDFGSSRSLLHINNSELRTGTPLFMSPEQFDPSGELTFASDFYSLGIIMYYMTTGQLPFNSNDYHQLEMLHSTIDPIPVRQLNPQADKKIETIIHKLLSKKIQDRYSTSLSLIKDLDRVLPNAVYFFDGIKIDQLDHALKVIKSRKYHQFPINISSEPDSNNNFQMITSKNFREFAKVENLDDGLMRLSLIANHDFSFNNKLTSDTDFYIFNKITRISNKSLILQFEKINTNQSFTRRSYYLLGAAVFLIISITLFLINLLPSKSAFAIYDLEFTSSKIEPNEEFGFYFTSNLDTTSYIESLIIAPYGKDNPAVQRIKPDQMFFKYSYSDIRDGEKEFFFALKAIDNIGRESNWVEKKITLINQSDQLRLTNIVLPERLRRGQAIRFDIEYSFSIPEDQILIEVTLEKGNRILNQQSFSLSSLEQTITTNEIGELNLKIRAYDKDRSLFSNLLDRRIIITEDQPDPIISITSQRKESNYILLGFHVADVVYENRSDINVQLIINGQVIDIPPNAYSVRYEINSQGSFQYVLRARTPDGRSGRTPSYSHSTVPSLTISMSNIKVSQNNQIRFSYSYNDQMQLDPNSYTIKLIVNNNNEYALSPTENSYEFTVESEGEYSFYLVLNCRDGRKAVSEIKKVTYSNI